MMASSTVAESGLAEATCTAPVNIAVIKYWGKRDEDLILPTNSSLSATLSQDNMHSKTTVRIMNGATGHYSDSLWLNGELQEIKTNKRLVRILAEMRRLRQELESQDPRLPILSKSPIHMASMNTFPTAAGLASSASGLACLTFTLAWALGPNKSTPLVPIPHISRLARLGSGSACRSLYGGFVAWDMGANPDGSDSIARQVAPETHWPCMQTLILVTSTNRKHTSSTTGMQTTVHTSPLFKTGRLPLIPSRMAAMESAILSRDFDAFAELTMRDGHNFHAVCLDTFPPVVYLNEVSHAVVAFVTAYHEALKVIEGDVNDRRQYRVAYTFDAGPNAVLYLLKEDMNEIVRLVNYFFPVEQSILDEEGKRKAYFGSTELEEMAMRSVDVESENRFSKLVKIMESQFRQRVNDTGSLKRLIHCSVGDGPRVLAQGWDNSVSLLNVDGLPKEIN